MTFHRYLADRWVMLAIAAVALALTALLLYVAGLDGAFIVFAVVLLALALAVVEAYDFLRRRRFYTEFEALCQSLDQTYLLTEVLDRPSFLEGRLAYDALQEATKAMNDRIAGYRRSSEEYRDYLETWIHEVKTPIAAAELATANDCTPATARIAGELARIDDCVEQALYYARGTTLERDYLIASVDLGDLVRSVVRDRSRVLIDAKVAPVLGDLSVTVLADAKWCAFVLAQVVDNAAKYRTPATSALPDAHLTFTAEVIEAGSAAERVVLHVADDGIGMPPEDVPRAFDRGFTGRNGRAYAKSTGMGLYLCRRLCDKMGLGITLASEEGCGTTVSIAFPVNRMYLL